MRIGVGWIAALAMAVAAPAMADPVREVAEVAGFSGLIGVQADGQLQTVRAFRPAEQPGPGPADVVRWASVTKMVTAILVLQEVDAGRLALDAPLSRYLPDWPVNGETSLAQLLRHRSGLANPDDLPDGDGDGMPDVYQDGAVDWRTVCAAAPKAAADAAFSYNNCDYLVLAGLLEAITGQAYGELVRTRISEPLGLASLRLPAGPRQEGRDGEAPEPRVDPAAYGPAGGLYGTVADMLKLDQALMDGRLVSPASRAAMFAADPASNFSGLSVWVYPVALPRCAGETVTLVERRGAISGVQVRNLMLVERNTALVAWTDQARTDFGEPWSGAGLTVDLLSALVCGAAPAA
ncbi:MAG TPA: serine hydrolase domain-containing protein [Brevundimonas sp.]|jgi:CubicO group peptidase (beta-lactamase class C family)|uniref:serine hydrolase domain-containing protein n=1 Tax=Brevundimonas sp. TaxID=1871086 RepID=UPI002E0F88D1|nr:serine hydrolase domain-containing protein [Brevundimonas sp.]